MPLTLEIVTPEARVYRDTVDAVVIPAAEGEVGVLPGHVPLLVQVASGELHVTKGTESRDLVVAGGFAQVDGDRVRVLAEFAINTAQIDENAVARAQQRAEEALQNRGVLNPAEIERLEGIVRFSVAQITARRKRR